jgi:hypothetical protein
VRYCGPGVSGRAWHWRPAWRTPARVCMGYADHSRPFNCGVQVSEVTLVPTEAAKLDVTRIVTTGPGQDPDLAACLAPTARARPLSASAMAPMQALGTPGTI